MAQTIDDYKKAWEDANKRGDQQAMAAAHAGAEAIRAKEGYSGGADGSERIALPAAQTSTTSSSTKSSTGSVSANSAGNAPAGLAVGQVVTTGGGDYQIVAPNTPGASYNAVSGYWSVKVDSQPSTGPSATQNQTPAQQSTPTAQPATNTYGLSRNGVMLSQEEADQYYREREEIKKYGKTIASMSYQEQKMYIGTPAWIENEQMKAARGEPNGLYNTDGTRAFTDAAHAHYYTPHGLDAPNRQPLQVNSSLTPEQQIAEYSRLYMEAREKLDYDTMAEANKRANDIRKQLGQAPQDASGDIQQIIEFRAAGMGVSPDKIDPNYIGAVTSGNYSDYYNTAYQNYKAATDLYIDDGEKLIPNPKAQAAPMSASRGDGGGTASPTGQTSNSMGPAATGTGGGGGSSYTGLLDLMEQKQLATLENTRNRLYEALERERVKIDPEYQKSLSTVSSESDRQSRVLAEFLAQRGQTQSGLAAQGEMHRLGQLQSAQGELESARADAHTQIAQRQTDADTDYAYGVEQVGFDRSIKELELELQQREQAKADAISTIGQYAGNYMEKIEEIMAKEKRGDYSESFLLPYLYIARNEKLSAMESAQALAMQQEFENQVKLGHLQVAQRNAAKSGASSSSKETTPGFSQLAVTIENSNTPLRTLAEIAAKYNLSRADYEELRRLADDLEYERSLAQPSYTGHQGKF